MKRLKVFQGRKVKSLNYKNLKTSKMICNPIPQYKTAKYVYNLNVINAVDIPTNLVIYQ